MLNYPDGMRESDIPGWNDVDGTMPVTCNASDVELGFADPDIVRSSASRIKNYINKGTPWYLVLAMRSLKTLISYMDNAPTFLVDCDFSGDADGIYSNNYFYWQCPKCNTEHEVYIDPNDY